MFVMIANRAGPARRITEGGREYLVVPVTMIVPGVLPGSKGALLYEPQEVARSAPEWEGVPLTLGHPFHPLTGDPLSADHPGVLSRQGLGIVRKPSVTPEGKLRAEGWFDLNRTQKLAPTVLSLLQQGRPIEVSTGLFTDNHPAPPGSQHNGRQFTHIARNYRPDHLAVLPNDRGACSIGDGCGVNNMGALRNTANVRDSRAPSCCAGRGHKCDDCSDQLPLPGYFHE